MDLKQLLRSLGYTEDQADKITAAMADNGLHITGMENAEDTITKLQAEIDSLKKAGSAKPKDINDGKAQEEIDKLKDELKRTKILSAAMIELNKENAKDVDYVLYKAEKTGDLDKLDIDDHGNVIGIQEMVTSLKASCASQFETADISASAAGAPVRTNIKRLDESLVHLDTPQTMEDAIAQKLAGNEEDK